MTDELVVVVKVRYKYDEFLLKQCVSSAQYMVDTMFYISQLSGNLLINLIIIYNLIKIINKINNKLLINTHSVLGIKRSAYRTGCSLNEDNSRKLIFWCCLELDLNG